ncbi:MAG: hypothetical protein Q4D35_03200 [Ruminococcus sp.]|nr:hypothetical protein [Ruminococcus sp.]
MDKKKEILKYVEWEHGIHYDSVEEAVEEYGMIDVFDCWMKGEGLIGYTSEILAVMSECGFNVNVEE